MMDALGNQNSGQRYVLLTAALVVLGQALHTGCAASFSTGTESTDDRAQAIAREIEEADIVKYQDGYFYLANAYTGLRIIDAGNMDQPQLMGSLQLGGRAVEMFIRGDFAFVNTSSEFGCAALPVQSNSEFDAVTSPDYDGSRLWVIDVSDKSAPQLVSTLDSDGFVTGTRRVGDVIYLAGNSSARAEAFITSINIANPENTVVVESQSFRGEALDINVSQNAMYVIGDDQEVQESTLVTYVDISDADGDIVIRDQFRVPGLVESRFFVDEYLGIFRIITEEFDPSNFFTRVALYTYDVSDPDHVARLAELPIITNESLRAVRFDGDRGYAVTFMRIDPLFVLDLSDPHNPQVTGELEVPGWSTHLVPMGDRLVGVGFDDANGFRPAVALYDVSDSSSPRQLSRVVLGGFDRYSVSSEATVDEKALKVVPEAGLILLPFSVFDFDTGQHVDSLQIVKLETDRLLEKGAIDHRGLVRRADLLDGRVWVLSDLAFQTLDIDDLDEPFSLGTIDIVDDQALLDAGLAECVDTARTRGTPVGAFFAEAFPVGDFILGGLLQLLFGQLFSPFFLFGF